MTTTLLLDADGVLQETAASFYTDIKALVNAEDADRFLEQIFAAERPALTGQADFREDLQTLLKQWQVLHAVDDVLAIWYRIDLVPGILSLLKNLRDRGCTVCLATNQQASRMQYMRHHMRLDQHFDRAYYSCELGVAKPSSEYFVAIQHDLGVAADQILFIDDSLPNIEGAARSGLLTEHFSLVGRDDAALDLAKLIRSRGIDC
ncbi:MAG: putative hydrolase of the HAD superfamily [Candidatus Azotimanducaceae bacterium]|jgi:putative hydrolase of the HAD superfamily